MKHHLKRLAARARHVLTDDSGAISLEYGFLMAFGVAAVTYGTTKLLPVVTGLFDSVATNISTAVVPAPSTGP